MLADLDVALSNPGLVAECKENKPNVYSLWGFGKWMRYQRSCKVCKRRLPANKAKTCSPRCKRRWLGWKKAARARRRGILTWFEFSQQVKRPLPMEVVAEKWGVPIEEARRRAEIYERRGRLVAYRGRTSPEIRSVGVPTSAVPSTTRSR
jgi:hypothetical protein